MQRAFEPPADLYPFDSHWLEVEGIPVHYVDEGTGPVLMLMHGNPTWSFLYRDIIRELRSEFRCIALDYPGMGLSGKPAEHGRADYGFTPEEHSRAVVAVAHALDLRDITMMVQDWGGPIGLGAAVCMPERIGRLVIGNTWAWPADPLDMKVFSNVLGRGPGRALIRHANLFVERLFPMGVERKERLTPAVMDAYRGPYPTPASREPLSVFPRAITTSRAFLEELESRLPRLADKPAIIVWGNKDKVFRKRELERWKALRPDAPVEILEGAGHFIQEDAPEQIAEAIRRFAGTGGAAQG